MLGQRIERNASQRPELPVNTLLITSVLNLIAYLTYFPFYSRNLSTQPIRNDVLQKSFLERFFSR